IQLMRESIRSVTPVFNTHRMVKEYAERLYEPAARAHTILVEDDGRKAVELSRWKDAIRKAWPQIQVTGVEVKNVAEGSIAVGDSLEVTASVYLGPIDPSFVTIQAYYGEEENNEI